MSIPVIFDCDNTLGLPLKEIDDGLTLAYLLGCPEIELLAVTATSGNGTVAQALQQTSSLLQMLGRPDIPVWPGQNPGAAGSNQAAQHLVELTHARPGEIHLLATGAQTNLAAAQCLDPGFFARLAGLAVMGGLLGPLRIGWRTLAELNLSTDPAAAQVVLQLGQRPDCPLSIFHGHICLQAPFGWQELRQVHFRDSWLTGVVRRWLLAFGLYCGVGHFYLWDLLPAVYLTHPGLFSAIKVQLVSDPAALARGLLRPVPGDHLTMPDRILHPLAFREIIISGWKSSGIIE
jgi:purine nucleosidase